MVIDRGFVGRRNAGARTDHPRGRLASPTHVGRRQRRASLCIWGPLRNCVRLDGAGARLRRGPAGRYRAEQTSPTAPAVADRRPARDGGCEQLGEGQAGPICAICQTISRQLPESAGPRPGRDIQRRALVQTLRSGGRCRQVLLRQGHKQETDAVEIRRGQWGHLRHSASPGACGRARKSTSPADRNDLHGCEPAVCLLLRQSCVRKRWKYIPYRRSNDAFN